MGPAPAPTAENCTDDSPFFFLHRRLKTEISETVINKQDPTKNDVTSSPDPLVGFTGRERGERKLQRQNKERVRKGRGKGRERKSEGREGGERAVEIAPTLISRSRLLCKSLYAHTRLTAIFPGLPWSAGTRKVKPVWILLKQETVSDSGITWAICKAAPRSRQITTPTPHHSVFCRPDALPGANQQLSKH